MKVIGLNKKVVNWNLQGCLVKDDKIKRSGPHLRGRKLLRALFPMDLLYEEVYLPESGGLTADFYLPSRKLIVETHGRQHYEFSVFHHKNWLGFLKAKQRDRDKQRWCELNNLTYCELPDTEDDEQWKSRVIAAIT